MKKLFALLLALVMSISLVACGGGGDTKNTNNTTSQPDVTELKDYAIGTWERSFTASTGENIKQVMEIYKGGTGKFIIYSNNDGEFSATWEIQDDVLNFTYSSPVTATYGFTLDTEDGLLTLTRVDDSSVIFIKVVE